MSRHKVLAQLVTTVLAAVALAVGLYVACSQAEAGVRIRRRPIVQAGTPDAAFSQVSTVAVMNSGAAGTSCVTPSITAGAGKHIACFMRWETDTATTVTAVSGNSNTYTIANSGVTNTSGSPDLHEAAVYANNINSGSTAVTFTISANGDWRMCWCAEYGGVRTTSPVDTSYGTSGVQTDTDTIESFVVASSSTGGAAVVVCGVTNANSRSWDTWQDSFTERLDNGASGEGALADRIVTGATSVAPGASVTGGGAATSVTICMSFGDY